MAFLRRHRVLVVLLGLGVIIAVLVGYRIKKQQAAAVPRRQLEIVVGVAKPVRKDLDVKLGYTADVLPNKRVAIFPKASGYIMRLGAELASYANQEATFFNLVLIPTLYVMFEERFPRTITPIEDDSAPPRREAHAQ
jgi:hypothetical protein